MMNQKLERSSFVPMEGLSWHLLAMNRNRFQSLIQTGEGSSSSVSLNFMVKTSS
jgi:hypothetical protein